MDQIQAIRFGSKHLYSPAQLFGFGKVSLCDPDWFRTHYVVDEADLRLGAASCLNLFHAGITCATKSIPLDIWSHNILHLEARPAYFYFIFLKYCACVCVHSRVHMYARVYTMAHVRNRRQLSGITCEPGDETRLSAWQQEALPSHQPCSVSYDILSTAPRSLLTRNLHQSECHPGVWGDRPKIIHLSGNWFKHENYPGSSKGQLKDMALRGKLA